MLVAQRFASHKRAVPPALFDPRLRALRRDRAFRTGRALFLYERAFDDILDRLSLIARRFDRALLIGCPDPGWKDRLSQKVSSVDVIDPGPLFAQAADGTSVVEDAMGLPPAHYDLCVAVGTLDSVNDLPRALLTIRSSLKPDSLFIGALAGGNMLPRLRGAMRAADQHCGIASPHIHPRIDAPSLAGLLSAAGFAIPVVDVDRARVAYSSLADLVRDLRGMGTTNILLQRSRRPLSRGAAAAAARHFASAADENGRTVEEFETLHFAAWTAADRGGGL